MMSCPEMLEMYADYIEGRVPFTKAMSMKLHLMMCVHCRRYYKQMGQVVELTAEHRSMLGLNDDADSEDALTGEAREGILAAFRDRNTG